MVSKIGMAPGFNANMQSARPKHLLFNTYTDTMPSP